MSLICMNETVISVNETTISVNETVICVNETAISVNETAISRNFGAGTTGSRQESKYLYDRGDLAYSPPKSRGVSTQSSTLNDEPGSIWKFFYKTYNLPTLIFVIHFLILGLLHSFFFIYINNTYI